MINNKKTNLIICILFYHSKIPSLTFSYKFFPSLAIGSKCFKSGSKFKLLLIQSENASCSSNLTECVVPSLDASDIPPKVSKFSFLETTCLKELATSPAFKSEHNYNINIDVCLNVLLLN